MSRKLSERFKKGKFWSSGDSIWYYIEELFVMPIKVISAIWLLKLVIKLWYERTCTNEKILSKFD